MCRQLHGESARAHGATFSLRSLTVLPMAMRRLIWASTACSSALCSSVNACAPAGLHHTTACETLGHMAKLLNNVRRLAGPERDLQEISMHIDLCCPPPAAISMHLCMHNHLGTARL